MQVLGSALDAPPAKQIESPEARLDRAIVEAKGRLNELQDPTNQLITAANTVGDAFGDTFQAILSGAVTTEEALAGLFCAVPGTPGTAGLCACLCASAVPCALCSGVPVSWWCVALGSPRRGGSWESPLSMES